MLSKNSATLLFCFSYLVVGSLSNVILVYFDTNIPGKWVNIETYKVLRWQYFVYCMINFISDKIFRHLTTEGLDHLNILKDLKF